MNEAADNADRLLTVQLELQLGRQPLRGRLRTPEGADRAFVGWLGFAEALQALHALTDQPTPKGSTMTDVDKPTLVLGATGKTGRRVLERLTARGVPTRAGSRAGQPPFDWEDPATWPAVVEGARAAYVSYYPDLALPGAVEAVGSFARLAVAGGVGRLVLLAGRGEEEAELAEDAVRASGAELTVLRATWFAQNFSEDYMVEGVLAGELALPAQQTPEPFVDADDIADVAVAALTQDGHVGEVYELTGPRLLTFAEAVSEIGSAVGREIAYVPVSVAEFADGAAAAGVPAEFVELLSYLFSEVLDGRNAHVADGVQRALGRPPRDFSQYARDAAASGVWNIDAHAAA
jgi:uncharacterized protein YbjT (DUF2867 family)